jgi:hypothetical protein
MWGFSGHQRTGCTFATGATSGSAVFIGGANHVSIEVPTFASYMSVTTANIYIQGSNKSDGTFRRIVDEGNYSAGAGIADWEVPSSTGNRTIICRPAARCDWIKVETSRVTTASMGCWVNTHY